MHNGAGPGISATDLPLHGPEDDRFGFHIYARTLTELIRSSGGPRSLTLGIYGPWGSGKTSLMRLIAHELRAQRRLGGADRFSVVWFEAWRYARHDTALWRALLSSVIDTLERDLDPAGQGERNRLGELREQIYRSVERTSQGGLQLDRQAGVLFAARLAVLIMALLGAPFLAAVILAFVDSTLAVAATAAAALIGVMLSTFFGKQGEALSADIQHILRRQESRAYQAQIQSLEQFHRAFAELIEHIHTQRRQRLVIFIDDLDRCLPEQAIGVLEAVKVFFSLPNCFVVLGVDERVIQRGLLAHYRHLEGETSAALSGGDYLEKIIQYPVDVPAVTAESAEAFVGELLRAALFPGRGGAAPAAEIARTLVAGIGGNPRALRRASAMLLFLHTQVALSLESSGRELVPRAILAAIIAVRYRIPELYTYFRDDPGPGAERLLSFPGKLYTSQFKDDALRQILGLPETSGRTIAQACPMLAAIFRDIDLGRAEAGHLRAVLNLFSTYSAEHLDGAGRQARVTMP